MTQKHPFNMPCSFAEFEQRCEQHGLSKFDDQTSPAHKKKSMGIYAVWVPTTSGAEVKCEIKPRKYTLGYGLGKNVNALREYLEDTGYECSGGTSFFSIDYVGSPSVDSIFNEFFKLIDTVKDVEGIVQTQRGMATKVFTREVAEQNIFETVAKRYRNAIDSRDQYLLDNHRVMLSADSIDHIITIGESVNRTPSNSYREHIVPCIMIHNQAIELTLNNAPVTEVAQFIKENLAIVLITPEEADLLDNTMGLRTCMPPDWNWGDSVFARLDAAKIVRK